jgi:TolB-like protein/Tfp pilus assembly protein PilF/class 3 adenylate cyclase
MPNEPELKAEIGHVLLIDIVGYSKLLINQQGELLQTLKRLVQETTAVRGAKDEGSLIRLATGDGMALVFRNDLEAPAECALQLGAALRQHPELPLRMGIHSGPIREVLDLNERANVTGAGIDLAQRVMDCGDAGHILVSMHVADDLASYPRWNPYLHDLGETEVKHGVCLHLFNLCTNQAGNPALPSKLRKKADHSLPAYYSRSRWPRWALGAFLLLSLGAATWWLTTRKASRVPEPKLAQTTPDIAPAASSPPAAPAIPEKSIAVLPFENLSSEQENAYFADGVQDEVLTYLAKVADLKVISRTSVMNYGRAAGRNLRQIGKELGVAHLLEGGVQRSGKRVRVNAKLIDARTGAHLWARTYDRDLTDVFAIQSEIAATIAEQLQAKLSPNEKAAIARPPTTDVAAFDLYIRAQKLLDSSALSSAGEKLVQEASDLLNEAVARDPSFFQAYTLLARVHDYAYFNHFEGDDHTRLARLAAAQAALDAAFRLQPDTGEAHMARAWHLYHGYRDYESALVELEIAGRKLPNDPRIFELTGLIRRRQGHWEKALRNFEQALELDPRNSNILEESAGNYFLLRRYPEAAAMMDRALAIDPDNAGGRVARAEVELAWKADTRPLHKAIDSIRSENPAALADVADLWLSCALAERDPIAAAAALAALGDDAVYFGRDFGEGVLARMTKDKTKADAAFAATRKEQVKRVQAQPEDGMELSFLGMIDAGLGRKEEALREGRRALELLPVAKDSLSGVEIIENFAIIAAWVGEKELACEQLEIAIRLKGCWSMNYGQLKLSPYWDPLRGYPRFEKIVASLAPKESKP